MQHPDVVFKDIFRCYIQIQKDNMAFIILSRKLSGLVKSKAGQNIRNLDSICYSFRFEPRNLDICNSPKQIKY